MAFANPNFDEIITTTLKNRSGQVADNVTNNNALLRVLNSKGNIQLEDGGQTLVQELSFAENSTFKFYSGYEILDVAQSEVISAAEYDWKQAAVAVTVSGLEMRQNMGRNRVINLITTRVQNAEDTMSNNLSTGIFSDGTGSGGKQIGGLALLVADDPTTGTVGGINRATFSFWQNQLFDISVSGSGAASATNIQGYMQSLWQQTLRSGDTTDLIIGDNNFYQFFWESQTSIQRITQTDQATAGFRSLEFNGPSGNAMVLLDDAAGTDSFYFLNTDFIFWKVHQAANFSLMEDVRSVNQDAIVKQLLFMGNMTMSNAARQGVMIP